MASTFGVSGDVPCGNFPVNSVCGLYPGHSEPASGGQGHEASTIRPKPVYQPVMSLGRITWVGVDTMSPLENGELSATFRVVARSVVCSQNLEDNPLQTVCQPIPLVYVRSILGRSGESGVEAMVDGTDGCLRNVRRSSVRGPRNSDFRIVDPGPG
jgi:hypothetical protein